MSLPLPLKYLFHFRRLPLLLWFLLLRSVMVPRKRTGTTHEVDVVETVFDTGVIPSNVEQN